MTASRFTPPWEPKLLHRQVLAKGIWWYADEIPYSITLIKAVYDYASADLDQIKKYADDIVWHDYIDLEINAKGEIFYWEFSDPKGELTQSPVFGSQDDARNHFSTYGRSEVRWIENA